VTGPRRADADAYRRLMAGAPPVDVSATWPAFGRRVGDGMREVTFVTDAAPGDEVMIHLNGITDSHRTDISPAMLERVPGTDRHVISYLLPDDLVVSYRFVAGAHLDRRAGSTREGWLRIHEAGRRDARNARSLRNPLGRESSVLVMPGGRIHPAWDTSAEAVESATAAAFDEFTIPIGDGPPLTILRRPRASRVLFLFDGDLWAEHGIAGALSRRADAEWSVVLVPSGSLERRSALLPHPDRLFEHLDRAVLPAAAEVLGILRPDRVVFAGESYGGLAAASVAALRPDVAATAIVQSGSFHFRAGAVPRHPSGETGDLVDALPPSLTGSRFVVTAGTEESGMGELADAFSGAVRARGAHVEARRYRGGHDYAWWRTGLFDALDAVGAGDA
jgi:enterochelin esterase-like enzyme